MLAIRRVHVLLSIVLIGLISSACAPATVSVPAGAAPTVPAAAAAATTAPDTASSNMATEVAAANAISNGGSPCIGVQPQADEKITPNGGAHWAAPDQVTDATHLYCAILTTQHGRIVIELFAKLAPINVNNFVFLAKNGYYENITWHRVIDGFMAQSGDPTGSGAGSPGYQIPLEVVPGLRYDREGRLGVARGGDPDTAGSQFFITFGAEPNLDPSASTPGYTIMGQVVEGVNVLRQIKIRNVDQIPDLPKGDSLDSVRIVDLGVPK